MMILIYLVLSLHSFGQEYQYSVQLRGKQIGKIKATIINEGDRKTYKVNSDTKVSMLCSISYTSQLEATFLGNELESAVSRSFQNGKAKDDSEVKRAGGKYHIYRGDTELTFNAAIKHSVVKLYFEEPLGITSIFSEAHGTFCKLVDTGNHVYKLILPDKNINYYHYKNGMLQMVKVDRAAYNLTFNLMSHDK